MGRPSPYRTAESLGWDPSVQWEAGWEGRRAPQVNFTSPCSRETQRLICCVSFLVPCPRGGGVVQVCLA